MAPPAITIKIDLGSESESVAGNTVAVSGDVPTPASGVGSAAASQSAAVVPTPFDGAAQGMAQADLGAPAPSPSLVPGGTAGSASDSSDLGNVPTPFSAGGFSPQAAGQESGVVPTPMDSVFGSSVSGDQAPTPDFASAGQAEETPPAPSPPAKPAPRKSRKKA